MSFCKSTILDLKLIELVKENPVLYDPNDKFSSDFNSREVVWQKIGDELKRPASECKARWVNIRDINRRILRKRISNPAKRGKMYKYYDQLSFMQPFYRDVLIQSNFEGEEDDNNGEFEEEFEAVDCGKVTFSDGESEDEKPILTAVQIKKTPSKKRKNKINSSDIFEHSGTSHHYDANVAPSDLDPTDKVDSFLLSIGATLKTLSPYHLNLAKSKIFAVVQEYELKQIVSKRGQAESGTDDLDIE